MIDGALPRRARRLWAGLAGAPVTFRDAAAGGDDHAGVAHDTKASSQCEP